MSAFLSNLVDAVRHGWSRLPGLFARADEEPPAYNFTADEIARLQRVSEAEEKVPLDEQTWSDLLLDRYLDMLSCEVSLFGRQVLYQRLRSGLDGQRWAALGERLRLLIDDPEQLEELHRTLRPLRHADADVAELLFAEASPPIPRWAGRTWPLPLTLVASIAAAALSPLAWLATAFVLYVLISVQLRYHGRMQLWAGRANSLQMLLRVCSLMGARKGLFAQEFAEGRELAGRTNRRLSRSRLASSVPGAGEYADWFMLSNVNHYFRSVALVFAHRDFLRKCYLRCANLEADVALARHLLATRTWSWAIRSEGRHLVLEQAVHPLLDGASPLSVTLAGKGAFLSGQNGVGKSTFLRTVGVNLAAARAFGFCYAARGELPALPVYASMQGEDSLLGGESLYLAELRRARKLLDTASGAQAGVYLIDEIFRGTNHVEGVSAAAAVLDSLAEQALVLVSSHNLILAPLLAHRLDPYCIRRAGAGLELAPGVLADTNGIALLAAGGFGRQVEDKAARVAQWLCAGINQPGAGGQSPLVSRVDAC